MTQFVWKKINSDVLSIPTALASAEPVEPEGQDRDANNAIDESQFNQGFDEGYAKGIAQATAEQEKLTQALQSTLDALEQSHNAVELNSQRQMAKMLYELFAGLFSYELSHQVEFVDRLVEEVVTQCHVSQKFKVGLSENVYTKLSSQMDADKRAQIEVDATLNDGQISLVFANTALQVNILDNLMNLITQMKPEDYDDFGKVAESSAQIAETDSHVGPVEPIEQEEPIEQVEPIEQTEASEQSKTEEKTQA